MGKKRKETEVKLQEVGLKRVIDARGNSLEVMEWKNEPAVLVDGHYILRHSFLTRQIQRAQPHDIIKEVSDEQ